MTTDIMPSKVWVMWILTAITLWIGLAGIIAGAVGNSWWKTFVASDNADMNKGLWRCCVKVRNKAENCDNRKEILNFNKGDRG